MNLDVLKSHEKVILLTEISGLIHDLGKLSEEFTNEMCLDQKPIPQSWRDHSLIVEYDTKRGISEAKITKNILSNCRVDSNLSVLDLLEAHHEKNWNKGAKDYSNGGSPHFAIKLLCASDKFDSEEDKGKASDKQSNQCLKISSAFGNEAYGDVRIQHLETYRTELYDMLNSYLDQCSLSRICERRNEYLRKMEKLLSQSLGETRRAANDVTIWQHSYITASMLKALTGQYYISADFREYVESIRGNYNNRWKWTINGKDYKISNIIREKFPFRIFSVNWDFFAYISQSHKIPDIIGRVNILDELRQRIKNLIEVECLCGNCIYEDEYGLHFLVPAFLDSEDQHRIEEIIYEAFNEKLEGMITPYIHLTENGAYLSELLPLAMREMRRNRETAFKPKWMENWGDKLIKNSLVCNVCGKGTYLEEEREKVCNVCKSIRLIGRKEETDQTVFIDEIAWNEEEERYENVALLVMNFDLGNWLNGKNVRKSFLTAAMEEKDLSTKGGEIKGIVQSRIGPLVAINGIPSKQDIADIENRIGNSLCSYQIVDDRTKIVQEIVCRINNVPAQQIYKDIDQILADVLGRYKLLELESRICCKNPSPSRLMRVWNNTKEFFEELEKAICDRSYEIRRCNLDVKSSHTVPPDSKAYELKIRSNSEEMAAEGVFDGARIHIVTPHANRFIKRNKDFEIEITDKTWAHPTKTYTCRFNELYTSFKAYRSTTISPDMFMFLVSASKTPEVLVEIKKRYMKVFGKVYGKLPLNISTVYFKRKMPFYTVLDSARRFLDRENAREGTSESEEIIVEVEKKPKIDNCVKIETDIGLIRIPIKLGNGETDYYHPYLPIENGQDAIQVEGCKAKHPTLLERGDRLKIYPSFFDFIFLDSNTRRFDISAENGKRPHPIFTLGPRPYYLEDIDKFHQIWKILEENCDNTQLNNFDSLLISKIEEWNLKDLKKLRENEEFRKLVEASIKNILRIGKKDPDFSIILNSVLSGMFFDVKELYHTILKKKIPKKKLRGEENE